MRDESVSLVPIPPSPDRPIPPSPHPPDRPMSSFLSRRAANRRAVVTHKMIAFRIQQEWFALPIQAAQRVIPMGQVYGISCQSEISLTRYQDKDIIVIDAERRIFGRTLEMKGQGAAVRGQEEDAGVERMGSTQDLAQDSTLNPQNSASAFSQILSEPLTCSLSRILKVN
ncbi:MAG: hypothetical protein HC769_24180 [Cyanobacteria bacterium CRU_2_1]|nr:hypothetical protein [Cyanobacteria bacterium CRU_2_1]